MDEARLYDRALSGFEIETLSWWPADGDYDDSGVIDIRGRQSAHLVSYWSQSRVAVRIVGMRLTLIVTWMWTTLTRWSFRFCLARRRLSGGCATGGAVSLSGAIGGAILA